MRLVKQHPVDYGICLEKAIKPMELDLESILFVNCLITGLRPLLSLGQSEMIKKKLKSPGAAII